MGLLEGWKPCWTPCWNPGTVAGAAAVPPIPTPVAVPVAPGDVLCPVELVLPLVEVLPGACAGTEPAVPPAAELPPAMAGAPSGMAPVDWLVLRACLSSSSLDILGVTDP